MKVNVVYNIWFYTYGLNVRQFVGFALACCASELGSLLCCQGLELELLVVAAGLGPILAIVLDNTATHLLFLVRAHASESPGICP